MTESANFQLDWGFHGLMQLLTLYNNQFTTVLDIGSGDGEHTRFFRFFNKKVFSVDLHRNADYCGDFMKVNFDRTFDVVWCSHVLEHQRNVGAFLEKIYDVLADDGLLAISLPVHPRQSLITGHLTSWNAGLLIYNLVLAGFDCSKAIFIHDYDLSLIVQKRPSAGSDIRGTAAYGAVEELAAYFPFSPTLGCNAEIFNWNWDTNYSLPLIGRPAHVEIKNKVCLMKIDLPA